ncbi:MAG: adenylate/guanylate cyclase domain-containing protein, partial [Candidatus Tumulicola sp.]
MRESYRAPSETVAFLFTDIVGSTMRWDANRAEMQAALRRHDGIVRAAIEAQAGRVFKTIGDAFCASFPKVGDALNAAIEAQRRLDEEDWEAVNGLRVRMAVHAGATDQRDGDYFGPALNRVARLLAAGHGGQVLVSGFAADAAAPELSAGIGLRALGMLPLKDIRDPERVFQLTAPGLQVEFKPLRAIEAPPNNLPRQASSFVGRHADLARVEGLLRGGALVTVVGTGGVGKTRLALAAAADTLNDTRDGAWFVDLAPLSDGLLVASTILTALGADQTSDAPAFDVLIDYLKPRDATLVLDNCEHVVAEAARVAAAIVASCPRVTILATSREALNVAGERLHRLSSLGDAEAANLFADRAQAVNPAFRLDDHNRAAVEDLCRRLDGIALAIELAAARLRSVSLDDLSRRLRLRVLVGGARDRQPRQQTMHALIDWSYNLLAVEEQRLFCDVSIFAGGFTLEAAAGVYENETRDEWRVLDLLTSLADKSLLVADVGAANQRYRLLESIREY